MLSKKQKQPNAKRSGSDPFRLTAEEQASLLQLANDAILAMDLDGNIVFWNDGARRLYGHHEGEAIGVCAHRLLDTEFPCALNQIWESVRSQGEWHGLLKHKNKSHEAVWVASRWTPRRNARGEIIGTFEINRDITAQRKAMEALTESEKWVALGRFAATLSHEIRNPLDGALGAVFLLRQRKKLSAEAVSYLTIISSQLQQIEDITTNTLHLYRDQRDIRELDLCALVQETCENLRRTSQFSNVALLVKCNRRCAIRAVRTDVRQIVTNLVMNAAEATGAGGRVRVTVSSHNDSGAMLSIANSGSYIESDVQRRLFDPSFTTKQTGHGLGLWIVSTLVGRIGGSMNVRSWRSGPHSSTVFSVRVPYAPMVKENKAA